MNRQDIYKIIDGERDYQNSRWNANTTTTEGKHSVLEFLVYMRDYIEEAMHFSTRNSDPSAQEFTLNSVRKVAALAVSCMEQHGVTPRKI